MHGRLLCDCLPALHKGGGAWGADPGTGTEVQRRPEHGGDAGEFGPRGTRYGAGTVSDRPSRLVFIDQRRRVHLEVLDEVSYEPDAAGAVHQSLRCGPAAEADSQAHYAYRDSRELLRLVHGVHSELLSLQRGNELHLRSGSQLPDFQLLPVSAVDVLVRDGEVSQKLIFSNIH